MKVRIYAKGPGFRESADLKSVINIMDGYGAGFDFCLKKSFIAHKITTEIPVPVVAFIGAQPGSLDIQLVTQIVAAIAPLAPQIFGNAWTLYKSAYDLVGLAVNFFRREQRSINITVADSPDASVLVLSDNQVSVTKDVYEAALKFHKDLNKIASIVKSGVADQIIIEPDKPELPLPVRFYAQNKNDFDVPSSSELEKVSIDFECTIIRFHKKTMNGSLEIIKDELRENFSFTIEPHLYEDCIKAFSVDLVKVTALREYETNALGESKIKSFHLTTINL